MPLSNPDMEGKKNLLLVIQLRWIAAAGQVVTILVAELWYRIHLPLLEMASVLGFLAALNLVSVWRHQRQGVVTNMELLVELLLDVTALTIQLYLSGGITNPFISLFLLQVGLGAVLLEAWSAWILATAAAGCFVWLTRAYMPLVLPLGLDESLAELQVQGMFVCFVLTAALLVLFLNQISRNLRDRDAHLADLRQRSAEEDHIVRLGLLASGAAHELGTPLSTISVILNDWRRMPVIKADPDLAEEIAEMQSQIGRCKAIVSGILLSSGEARGEGTQRTTAPGFINEVVAEWRDSRSPSVLEFRNLVRSADPIISDTALKQVIFNVFDNALEASPDWVSVTAEEAGGDLVMTVRDAGPGFPPDMLDEIGKPYRSTKNRTGGGLGLFLVMNVIRKLGGRVTVRNELNGACVTLAFPLSALSPGGAHGH
ncbi:ATP-binding protein [Aquabacter sp. P-9]|uniref:ATP-binding protein n=1 Tax=Aquabacter sediminis TaxID=3029197 RepID=UPI00237E02C3|nr:ATP-binding protein [Aquabacter sp. P-9]MDE1566592.1 ATP-binding protein [Aquabacter sp. P-9]